MKLSRKMGGSKKDLTKTFDNCSRDARSGRTRP